MVNSGSFDSDGLGDRNAKVGCTQPHNASDSTQSSSPVTASVAASCKPGVSQTADDSDLPSDAHAIEPTPTKTEFNSDMPLESNFELSTIDGGAEQQHVEKSRISSSSSSSSSCDEEKTSLCCSLPLDKLQGVLTTFHPPKANEDAVPKGKPSRKLLCLYCDRSFVSSNLRQKHVERVHSVKQNRRISSRRHNQLTVTPCVYCTKLNATENTLKDLFHHLVSEHSRRYFGCLPCEDRFVTSSLLADHNVSNHQSSAVSSTATLDMPSKIIKTAVKHQPLADAESNVKFTRSQMKPKLEDSQNTDAITKRRSKKLKELRNKKLSVKSSRIALKRRESKRLQALAKLTESQKKKRSKQSEKKQSGIGKRELMISTKSTEKSKSNLGCVNPYPEFDHFYRVKKITDHSIDNLKISSLTFDDVFDKAFFNRIRCNIEENLLHHIDGKLFKNEESESRISNFEKVSSVPQELQNSNSENYGCDLSLNAVTPVASLSLNSQFGEDFESQIEYGAKPSKKKPQPRKDEFHYKYFTRRKFQASILEHKENRDLSKLDMWTQLVIKKRQQKMLDDKKTAKEILEYSTCDEYKSKLKREELNRILDRRGPFEDLREEASKKAALDKLNSLSDDSISHESFTGVRQVLEEILNRAFAISETVNGTEEAPAFVELLAYDNKEDVREMPSFLNLCRSSTLTSDGDIDKSDKITLICSSQETENFELPTNQVRGKNELIELSGEWARCRMYICAACGAKLPNMKYLMEHKSLYHQNVWVQHYEFVGNQSELYRHLSIPALGKVGEVEETVQCKLWKRSDARLCTKCDKQCNSLGELHRHILECGGDWTWMLARKKCKYRPFGTKSRRKRRGLVHRVHHKRKTETTEKKKCKKKFQGPRQRPSDADTIQRMLANLPAKRSTRKLISLQEGIYRARKNTQLKQLNQKKVKCGKVIYKSRSVKETTEKTVNTTRVSHKPQKSSSSTKRRSLRSFNKVLASRILDTNTKLTVKRKLKVLNERQKTKQSAVIQDDEKNVKSTRMESLEQVPNCAEIKAKNTKNETTEDVTIKRSSPRTCQKNAKKKINVKKLLTGKINIKSFFPVKKRKNREAIADNQNVESLTEETIDIKTRSKRKSKDVETEELKMTEKVETKADIKKPRSETFRTLVRAFSNKKKNTNKIVGDKTPSKAQIITKTEREDPVSENVNRSVSSDEQDKTACKKRKLKHNFKNIIINTVKKLKTDHVPCKQLAAASETSNTKHVTPKDAFLGESPQEMPDPSTQPEKIVIPSTLETKIADLSAAVPIVINFSETNANSTNRESIFELESNNEKSLQAKGELNFDNQVVNETNVIVTNLEEDHELRMEHKPILNDKMLLPISIETCEKSKTVPLVSPNVKGKIRKPARGLNDCIAMLTNKLQQKTSESNDDSYSTVPESNLKSVLDLSTPKTECILRIPTFKTQNVFVEPEETALDLSTKSPNNPPDSIKLLDNYIEKDIISSAARSDNQMKFPGIVTSREGNTMKNSVDNIIEEVVKNIYQEVTPVLHVPKLRNSVDETIQTVIDGYIKELQENPNISNKSKNSVEDIIEFVISAGWNNVEKTNASEILTGQKLPGELLDKLAFTEKIVRKLGSVRKRNKKATENVKVDAIASAPIENTEISNKHTTISNQVNTLAKNETHISGNTSEDPGKINTNEQSNTLGKIGSVRKRNKKATDIVKVDVIVASAPIENTDISNKHVTISNQVNIPAKNETNVEAHISGNSSEDPGKNNTNEQPNTLDELGSVRKGNKKATEIVKVDDIVASAPTENTDISNKHITISNQVNTPAKKETNVEIHISGNTSDNPGKTNTNEQPNTLDKSSENSKNTKDDLVEERLDSKMNDAFIHTHITTLKNSSLIGSKRGARKVGQNRKKSHVPDVPKNKFLLETHLDELLNVSEIQVLPISEIKINEVKFANEDEPCLLENKIITSQDKPKILLSDSEDDIPLACLIKTDDAIGNGISDKEPIKRRTEEHHGAPSTEKLSPTTIILPKVIRRGRPRSLKTIHKLSTGDELNSREIISNTTISKINKVEIDVAVTATGDVQDVNNKKNSQIKPRPSKSIIESESLRVEPVGDTQMKNTVSEKTESNPMEGLPKLPADCKSDDKRETAEVDQTIKQINYELTPVKSFEANTSLEVTSVSEDKIKNDLEVVHTDALESLIPKNRSESSTPQIEESLNKSTSVCENNIQFESVNDYKGFDLNETVVSNRKGRPLQKNSSKKTKFKFAIARQILNKVQKPNVGQKTTLNSNSNMEDPLPEEDDTCLIHIDSLQAPKNTVKSFQKSNISIENEASAFFASPDVIKNGETKDNQIIQEKNNLMHLLNMTDKIRSNKIISDNQKVTQPRLNGLHIPSLKYSPKIHPFDEQSDTVLEASEEMIQDLLPLSLRLSLSTVTCHNITTKSNSKDLDTEYSVTKGKRYTSESNLANLDKCIPDPVVEKTSSPDCSTPLSYLCDEKEINIPSIARRRVGRPRKQNQQVLAINDEPSSEDLKKPNAKKDKRYKFVKRQLRRQCTPTTYSKIITCDDTSKTIGNDIMKESQTTVVEPTMKEVKLVLNKLTKSTSANSICKIDTKSTSSGSEIVEFQEINNLIERDKFFKDETSILSDGNKDISESTDLVECHVNQQRGNPIQSGNYITTGGLTATFGEIVTNSDETVLDTNTKLLVPQIKALAKNKSKSLKNKTTIKFVQNKKGIIGKFALSEKINEINNKQDKQSDISKADWKRLKSRKRTSKLLNKYSKVVTKVNNALDPSDTLVENPSDVLDGSTNNTVDENGEQWNLDNPSLIANSTPKLSKKSENTNTSNHKEMASKSAESELSLHFDVLSENICKTIDEPEPDMRTNISSSLKNNYLESLEASLERCSSLNPKYSMNNGSESTVSSDIDTLSENIIKSVNGLDDPSNNDHLKWKTVKPRKRISKSLRSDSKLFVNKLCDALQLTDKSDECLGATLESTSETHVPEILNTSIHLAEKNNEKDDAKESDFGKPNFKAKISEMAQKEYTVIKNAKWNSLDNLATSLEMASTDLRQEFLESTLSVCIDTEKLIRNVDEVVTQLDLDRPHLKAVKPRKQRSESVFNDTRWNSLAHLATPMESGKNLSGGFLESTLSLGIGPENVIKHIDEDADLNRLDLKAVKPRKQRSKSVFKNTRLEYSVEPLESASTENTKDFSNELLNSTLYLGVCKEKLIKNVAEDGKQSGINRLDLKAVKPRKQRSKSLRSDPTINNLDAKQPDHGIQNLRTRSRSLRKGSTTLSSTSCNNLDNIGSTLENISIAKDLMTEAVEFTINESKNSENIDKYSEETDLSRLYLKTEKPRNWEKFLKNDATISPHATFCTVEPKEKLDQFPEVIMESKINSNAKEVLNESDESSVSFDDYSLSERLCKNVDVDGQKLDVAKSKLGTKNSSLLLLNVPSDDTLGSTENSELKLKFKSNENNYKPDLSKDLTNEQIDCVVPNVATKRLRSVRIKQKISYAESEVSTDDGNNSDLSNEVPLTAKDDEMNVTVAASKISTSLNRRKLSSLKDPTENLSTPADQIINHYNPNISADSTGLKLKKNGSKTTKTSRSSLTMSDSSDTSEVNAVEVKEKSDDLKGAQHGLIIENPDSGEPEIKNKFPETVDLDVSLGNESLEKCDPKLFSKESGTLINLTQPVVLAENEKLNVKSFAEDESYIEHPLKIVINKQKTRRKSKSFKKVDLKGENDLFQDFALVIKKQKRNLPIISFGATDAASSKDPLSYVKKPIEIVQPTSKPTVADETDALQDDLDVSVEEMDMELEEIPITSNIIERDSSSFVQNTIEIDLLDKPNEINEDTFIKAPRKSRQKQNNRKGKTRKNVKRIQTKNLISAKGKDNSAESNKSIPQTKINNSIFGDTIFGEEMLVAGNFEKISEIFNKKLNGCINNETKGYNISNFGTELAPKEPFEIQNDISTKKLCDRKGLPINSEDNMINNATSKIIESDVNSSSDGLNLSFYNCMKNILSAKPRTCEKEFNDNRQATVTTKVGKSDESVGLLDWVASKCTENVSEATCASTKTFVALKNEGSGKEKDLDSIYTFTETEDLESENPKEAPRKIPKTQKFELCTDANLDLTTDLKKFKEEERQNKLENTISNEKYASKMIKSVKEAVVLDKVENLNVGEIKENHDKPETGRQKSIRGAKVKALEHIHDVALAELTDSERNREMDEVTSIQVAGNTEVVSRNTKKNSNKKQKKAAQQLPEFEYPTEPFVAEKSAPLLIDLVADWAGLEELENSIEREINSEIHLINEESKNELVETSKEGKVQLNNSEENQELRRSRRGSRKIASYNENDLIDPLLDEIDGKRKHRRKEIPENLAILDNKFAKKGKETEKKMNSDELFDLLKASTSDDKCALQPQKTLIRNLENINEDINDDNSDDIFEGIREKTALLVPKNLSEENKDSPDSSKIFDGALQINEDVLSSKNPIEGSSLKILIDENSESVSLLPSDLFPSNRDWDDSREDKIINCDNGESNYCEICNKSFISVENLIKHKRTLTHIQKLSEVEAKEVKEKSKTDQIQLETKNYISSADISSKIALSSAKVDINIGDILNESEKPYTQSSPAIRSSFPNNQSLKLADIINDVLNKPVLDTNGDESNRFSNIIMQNTSEVQPEVRRYKSLGERKSFDSDKTIKPTESHPSKTILEKQISLLENIIESQKVVSYIDDISMSSNNSVVENNLDRQSPSEVSLKQDDSSNLISGNTINRPTSDDNSFLKPTQYEEISEDSANLRNYEDQKLRKTLNRDEELFLECCSLLKSGSEVSNYSNKRSQNNITMGLKQHEGPDWLERKPLKKQHQFSLVHDYSDVHSRNPTPLGDSYDDASNSNTISSSWDLNEMTDFEGGTRAKQDTRASLNFEQVLNKNRRDPSAKFGGLLPKTITREPRSEDVVELHSKKKKYENIRQMITKGARKVFEGLRVSIPTEELNLEKVLSCSQKSKNINLSNVQMSSATSKVSETPPTPSKPSRIARKSKPVKKSQIGGNVLFKVNKKKVLSPTATKKSENEEMRSYDVYDFEETQDNTEVFTKPDFRTFRNMKSGENVLEHESDTESRDLEPFIAEPESVTSSVSSYSSVKPSTQENITKKKCMIMGRIFKNAAKTKLEDIDEEMRELPVLGNDELVESYVASCQNVTKNEVKPKLSEKEINQLFDRLLENKVTDKESANSTLTKTTVKSKTDSKKSENKKKMKAKNRKRPRTNSDSTDDEFNLNKSVKKRANRKSGKAEDNSINLEQELKECIGVASRKSQRKCTSGKQNVLVEYWSSDDSQFEAFLESQKLEQQQTVKSVKDKEGQVEEVASRPEFSTVGTESTVTADSETKISCFKPKKSQCKKRPSVTLKEKPLGNDSSKSSENLTTNRRKRAAANPLYHWSSSSEDETQDLIEIKPIRDEMDDDDRPVQHGWIVGDSPKKLVTMLAQAKGKKTDIDCVKEQGKKRSNAIS